MTSRLLPLSTSKHLSFFLSFTLIFSQCPSPHLSARTFIIKSSGVSRFLHKIARHFHLSPLLALLLPTAADAPAALGAKDTRAVVTLAPDTRYA